ncbi:MAG: hypothetical protein OXI83_14430 [Gemmatimonadota bacterium]|nr:hypothetical protein [Gemmatimonadota bacterium]
MAHTPDSPPTAPAAAEALVAPRRGFLAAGWAKFSDNAIPSLVVAVIAGLVLFFFNETGDRITRLEESIDAHFAAVDSRFTKLEDEVNARFAKLEENQQQLVVTLATLIGEFSVFQEDVNNRFAAVDARLDAIETRLTKLEENQQEIAVTLARLVALFEAHFESPANPSG